MGARSYLIDMTVKLAVIIYIYAEIFNLFHSSQVFRTKRKYNIIITITNKHCNTLFISDDAIDPTMIECHLIYSA